MVVLSSIFACGVVEKELGLTVRNPHRHQLKPRPPPKLVVATLNGLKRGMVAWIWLEPDCTDVLAAFQLIPTKVLVEHMLYRCILELLQLVQLAHLQAHV